jgi:hypothetical protein
MSRAPRWIAPLLLLLPIAPRSAPAQDQLSVAATARVTRLSLRSTFTTGNRSTVTGPIVSAEARLGVQFLVIRGGYGQGSLGGGGTQRRGLYVEGFGLLGIEPTAGLELGIGPQVRSRVIEGTRQRLVVWRLRGRYEGSVGFPDLRAWIEVTAGRPDRTFDQFNRWWGGAVGVGYRPREGAVGIAASYAIDEARVGTGPRRETIEGLSVSLSAYLR